MYINQNILINYSYNIAASREKTSGLKKNVVNPYKGEYIEHIEYIEYILPFRANLDARLCRQNMSQMLRRRAAVFVCVINWNIF